MIKQNTWVQIEKVILTPENRSPLIPDDTKKFPLIMWVKGFLQADANIGDIVEIKTKTRRVEEGKLVKAHPTYNHSFGNYVEEFEEVARIIFSTLEGDNNE